MAVKKNSAMTHLFGKLMKPKIPQNYVETRRVEAWRSVFEKTCRLIGNGRISIKIGNSPQIGFTNGQEIVLSKDFLSRQAAAADQIAGIMRVKGLVYHEMAHILFGPRRNQTITRSVSGSPDHLLQTAFLMLEDQRVETIFGTEFTPARRYFEATVLEQLANGNITPMHAYLFIQGRTFMDRKMVRDARNLFKEMYEAENPGITQEVKDIVNEYVRLDVIRDHQLGFDLILKFADILRKLKIPPQPNCTGGQDQSAGTSQPVVQQVRAQVQKDQNENDKQDQQDQQAQSSPGEGDQDDHQPQGGQNPPPKKSPQQQAKDLQQQAKQKQEEAMGDESLKDDAKETLKAIKSTMDKSAGTESGGFGKKTRHPSSEEQGLVNKCVRLLKEIKTESEPEVMRRKSTGRIDMQKLLQANPNDFDVFTSYDEGDEDRTTLEAVILVDNSGSMQGNPVKHASSSIWILKRAFDKLDFKTTVIVFNSSHQVLYGSKNKVPPMVTELSSEGGTSPRSALMQAEKILMFSDQWNKVLVVVTDGDWGETQACEDIIKRANGYATTMILGLDNAVRQNGKHGAERGYDIDDASKIADAVKQLVVGLMARVVMRD